MALFQWIRKFKRNIHKNPKNNNETWKKNNPYFPTQFLRISSVFSHFLTNFPGSTSSVLHRELTIFLVEHRSPLELPKSLISREDEDELSLSSSSSFQIHPILLRWKSTNAWVFSRVPESRPYRLMACDDIG